MRRRRSSPEVSLFAFQDLITAVTGIMIFITLLLAIELLDRTLSSPRLQTEEIIRQLKQQITESKKEIDRLEAQRKESDQIAKGYAVLDVSTLRRKLKERREQLELLRRQLRQLRPREESAFKQYRQLQSDEKQQGAGEERKLADLRRRLKQLESTLNNFRSGNRVFYNSGSKLSRSSWIVEISDDKISVAPLGRKATPFQFASVARWQSWVEGLPNTDPYFLLVVKPNGVTRFRKIRASLQQSGHNVGYDLIAQNQTAIDPNFGAGTP